MLLVTAGDNPHRLVHEKSFARLTGSRPLDASNGKRQRHRLNRGDDRHPTAGWVDWYNNRSLDYFTPEEFEQAHFAAINREATRIGAAEDLEPFSDGETGLSMRR